MIKQLQELGMLEKEAQVYLAALELGSSTVQIISRKSGVNRATTYVQVESLIRRGLMSSVIRGKKRYFNAESPDQLVRLLEIKRKEIDDKKEEFEKRLPELQAIFNLAEEKPKVRFFEGVEGLKAMQKDILNTKIDVFKEVANVDLASQVYPDDSNHYGKQIKDKLKDIPAYVIYTSRKGDFKPSEEGNRKRLFASANEVNFSSDIVIYGKDKIAFINSLKKNGVLIENKEIFDTVNSLFDLIWEKNAPR